MSVILSAASCIDGAVKLRGMKDAAEMFAAIESRGNATKIEIFLPHLSGGRTPHNDPDSKDVLFGLTHESDAAAIGQAVLEGVAFAFRDGMDALTDSGAVIDTITVIGGGAVDVIARGLLNAVKLIAGNQIEGFVKERYAGWQEANGEAILSGKMSLAEIADAAVADGIDPQPRSGRQELMENIISYAL